MHIDFFPRPSADTGIGLHWCAGQSRLPIQQVRGFWIPELRALGAAWIKLNDHTNCLPLVEEFLAADIQPIVRVYRAAPNPSTLNQDDLASVAELVRAGVRYFEVSYRPDLPAQWRNGLLPPDAQSLVARHLAQDMAEVLALGGLPALPALHPTSGWDLISELIRLGKRDILQGPIWQAIHTPGLNRPPHYPDDLVHREGAPLTQGFYMTLAEEEWEGDAWQGRSLAEVNRLRRRAAESPQPEDESGGMFDVDPLHAHHREMLGRAIPILSTSGGYVVGAGDDPRYPAITPSLHLSYTLEACRMMMGSSTRASAAPDYLFCTTFWLLANQVLDSSRPARENDAWYSAEHENGLLPIVPILQAEAKRLRHAPQVSSTETPMGSSPEWPQNQKGVIPFTPALPPGRGAITGKIQGGASVNLRLIHLESGLQLGTISRANGDYRFVDLPGGRYSVWVEEPPGNHRNDILLEDGQTIVVDLMVLGWGYEISEDAEGTRGMFHCSVALTSEMASAPSLRLRGAKGERVLAMVRSGKDRIARCSAGPLEPGAYDVELLGIPDSSPSSLRATVPIGRANETHIHFVYSRVRGGPKSLTESVIQGQVANGAAVQITLHDASGRKRSVTTDPRGRYRFAGLSAGSYSITVFGLGQTVRRTRLGLDGENSLQVDFVLSIGIKTTPPARSSLRGHAPGQAGRGAILTSQTGTMLARRIDEDGNFGFSDLPPGEYDLIAGGFQATGLQLGKGDGLEIEFPASNSQWQVDVHSRTALRRPRLVRVQVVGHTGAAVDLQAGDGRHEQRLTGSAAEYGPFAVEFGPLEPGDYTIEVGGVDVTASFTLHNNDAVAVVFRRGGALHGKSRLHHLPLPSSSSSSAHQ